MPAPDIEAPATRHKVRVDIANNVSTHFFAAGEGPKAALVIHGASRRPTARSRAMSNATCVSASA